MGGAFRFLGIYLFINPVLGNNVLEKMSPLQNVIKETKYCVYVFYLKYFTYGSLYQIPPFTHIREFFRREVRKIVRAGADGERQENKGPESVCI